MKTLKIISLITISLLFLGCPSDNEPRGTYIGEGNAFFDQLTFKSGNKVELVFMGSTSEVQYQLEDDKVKISNTGQNQILTITENGCLDGGALVGTYCKQ